MAPDLYRRLDDGSVEEARLDLQAQWPGEEVQWLDVTVTTTGCEHAASPGRPALYAARAKAA
eukprot:8208179-Lingulodinium_polyedra.AAC.1